MYGQCWKCGKWGQMERHHIFEGVANRKKSEEYGLVVLLCGEECHRNGREAAHRCGETALRAIPVTHWMEILPAVEGDRP